MCVIIGLNFECVSLLSFSSLSPYACISVDASFRNDPYRCQNAVSAIVLQINGEEHPPISFFLFFWKWRTFKIKYTKRTTTNKQISKHSVERDIQWKRMSPLSAVLLCVLLSFFQPVILAAWMWWTAEGLYRDAHYLLPVTQPMHAYLRTFTPPRQVYWPQIFT